MPTLYILCGLPGSGKSTWARQQRITNPNTVIVNKDGIRTMLCGSYYYGPDLEPLVKIVAISAVLNALPTFDVIVDETNITKEKRRHWLNLLGEDIADPDSRKIVWFKETERNLEYRMRDPRGISQGKWASVIEGMKTSFEPPTPDEGEIIEVVL